MTTVITKQFQTSFDGVRNPTAHKNEEPSISLPPERQLSDRERTVLLLAADGLTDKEIAKHLQLSQRTIGTYWERMRDKLGHFSRTQLVAHFVRNAVQTDESAKYRSLFASWEEGVWIVLPNGNTLYANSRIAELFDLQPEQLERMNSRDLIQKATNIPLENLFESTRSKDRNIEFRVTKVDGTILWLSMVASAVSNGKSIPGSGAVVLRLTDVTIQRRVKQTLDSCESSINFLSDHSSDLIARFDSKLICTSVNPSFEALVSDAVIGKTVRESPLTFIPTERWISCLQSALKSGEAVSFECRCPGLTEILTTHALPLPTEDGKPQAVMSITTRKPASPK